MLIAEHDALGRFSHNFFLHAGMSFIHHRLVNTAVASFRDVLLHVDEGLTQAIISVRFDCEQTLQVQVYENSELAAPTPAPPGINRNRAVGTPSVSGVINGPALSDTGDLIISSMLAPSAVSNGTDGVFKFIGKPGVNYTARAINRGDASARISINIIWDEC